jgi:uncharacterized RDD family membrane protein YckC
VRRALIVFALVVATPALYACPVCYGSGPGPGTSGLNNAIIFLLIIVGLVQAGFVALFWTFWKRSKALQRRREQFHVIQGGA